nr:hypothetical protein [uncultured Rhodoferax sp.]
MPLIHRNHPNRKLEVVMPFIRPTSYYPQVTASDSVAPTAWGSQRSQSAAMPPMSHSNRFG